MNSIRINKRAKGFTLVEAIGVLAILAILLGFLIPKIFNAIENAKLTSIVKSCDAVKTAIAMNVAKYGKLSDRNGNLITYSTSIDAELLYQGLLDARIYDKIGIGNTNSTFVCVGVIYGDVTKWDFNGDGVIDVSDLQNKVVKVRISSIPRKLAMELSRMIDGDSLSSSSITSADTAGRVIYGASHGAGDNWTTAYIYLYHF